MSYEQIVESSTTSLKTKLGIVKLLMLNVLKRI